MKTDDLIQQLAGNLTPVAAVKSPWNHFFAGFAGSLAAATLGLAIIPVRGDIRLTWIESAFLLPSLGLLLCGAALLFALVLLSFPGRSGQRASLGAASVLFFSCGGAMLAWTASSSTGWEGDGGRCAIIATILGVVPLGLLLLLLRKAAPTRPGLSSGMAGVCAAAFGAFTMGLCCTNGHPGHLLEWHMLLPMAALAALGFGLGRSFLRW